jgi:hypothetical protein
VSTAEVPVEEVVSMNVPVSAKLCVQRWVRWVCRLNCLALLDEFECELSLAVLPQ